MRSFVQDAQCASYCRKISPICLLAVAATAFVGLILSAFGNAIIISAVILYIIGAVMAKTQKME
jgi:hypothetical protein